MSLSPIFCSQLENVLEEYHDSLLVSELGKSKSAYGAIKVMNAIRNSDSKTIKKILTDEKNKDIVYDIFLDFFNCFKFVCTYVKIINYYCFFRIQVYDLLGASLNEQLHRSALETLNLANVKNFDMVERYLWSASIKFNPKIEIINSNISKK